MKRLMIAAALGVPFAVTPAIHAQDFNQGGAAGCYDPSRTPLAKQRLLRSVGAEPCQKPKAPRAPALPDASPPPSNETWYGGDNAVSVDGSGAGVTLSVYCSEANRLSITVTPTALMKGGFQGSERQYQAYQEREQTRVFSGVGAISVAVHGRSGTTALTIPRIGPGNYRTTITRPQLAALKASDFTTATTPRWTARFTGRGAGRELAALRC